MKQVCTMGCILKPDFVDFKLLGKILPEARHLVRMHDKDRQAE